MFIRLACSRLLMHRSIICFSICVSLLLLLLYIIVGPTVIQKPAVKVHKLYQYVVPANSPTVPTDFNCSFFDCFNIYRCGLEHNGNFKVYVYPMAKHVDLEGTPIGGKMSKEYHSMLSAIVESKYYTRNPEEACVFVPSIDTLNQNRFRVKETSQALALLP